MFIQKNNSPKLKLYIEQLHKESLAVGLDPYTTIFEVLDYKKLNEVAAFGGFPTRYPHWRWGMDYDRLSKNYRYGLGKIYELVINNDPCYAYLLDSNSEAIQKTVIAHVYGHSDFFKNNLWFKQTHKKMLNQMASHATYIKKIIDEIGYNKVENFIDICLSLEDLIDINSYKSFPKSKSMDIKDSSIVRAKNTSKAYLDKYMNKKDIVPKKKEAEENILLPQDDILLFLVANAPLAAWQKNILSIIRDESYYFLPQRQTKILNEGWATYWHSEMMTKIRPLAASEIVDYCDQYSSIIQNTPGQLNPYRLGLNLLRHIKNRWDKGRFGIEYLTCTSVTERQTWDTKVNKGIEKIFEVRKIHNDVTFIDEFVDDDFCREHDLFVTSQKSTNTSGQVEKDYSAKEVKKELLNGLTNIGNPIIKVIDSNYNNSGQLVLKHKFCGKSLRKDYAMETLKNIHSIWLRPVHLVTKVSGSEKIWSYPEQEANDSI